ncbi:sugar transferase [Candidatus Uhrbacteria bacterium]|jgi:exopolysaccharide biosynthesis polyprenyl glycosylphosphotransferase|nr:sugar transferase [Candidatus Uhrbacteria bacterium]MBT7716842.1 sugar transferase [Candidatus Uhrbacteria bacterium]
MKRVNLFFAALLLPLDYIVLVGAACFAYWVRFSPMIREIRPVVFDLPFDAFIKVTTLSGFVFLLIFAFSGLYVIRQMRLATEFVRIVLAVSASIAVVLGIAFFSRELFDSRFIVLAVWGFAIVFISVERYLIRMLQRSLRNFGIGLQRIVIIGKTKSGQSLKKYFQKHPRIGFEVVEHTNHFTNSTIDKILALKNKGMVDAIMLANPEVDKKEIRDAKSFSDNEQLNFYYLAEVFPSAAVKPVVHTLAGQPIIEVPKTPLDGWGAIWKRGFDVIMALIFITLTSPFMIVAALALFIEQPGNVFFVHKRVGQGGKSYNHLKFRSMIKDAHKYRFDPEFIKKYGNERGGTPLFKLTHDPRITKVGRIVRKLSIDELPELFMVLIGRMSLIGPRPHMPEEVADYKPHQKQVLTIKPGMTGMAQVGGRADLDFDEEVQLDMHYIQNWSPWLDLIILFKTPIVVIFGKGAY